MFKVVVVKMLCKLKKFMWGVGGGGGEAPL